MRGEEVRVGKQNAPPEGPAGPGWAGGPGAGGPGGLGARAGCRGAPQPGVCAPWGLGGPRGGAWGAPRGPGPRGGRPAGCGPSGGPGPGCRVPAWGPWGGGGDAGSGPGPGSGGGGRGEAFWFGQQHKVQEVTPATPARMSLQPRPGVVALLRAGVTWGRFPRQNSKRAPSSFIAGMERWAFSPDGGVLPSPCTKQKRGGAERGEGEETERGRRRKRRRRSRRRRRRRRKRETGDGEGGREQLGLGSKVATKCRNRNQLISGTLQETRAQVLATNIPQRLLLFRSPHNIQQRCSAAALSDDQRWDPRSLEQAQEE